MKLRMAVLAALIALPAAPVYAQSYGDQPPPGDYWRSCRNVNLDGYGGGATLSATCRDDRGRSQSTSLAFARCNGPVTNRDGQLVCARDSYGRPDYGRQDNGGYYGGGGYSGGGYGSRPGAITLYAGPMFQGPSLSVSRETSNLPKQYNDQALSLRVQGGVWQVCADSDFGGRCQIVDRDVPNLNDLGLGEAISSLRQVR